jgi:NADH-quinone oxidoreductase subunit L
MSWPLAVLAVPSVLAGFFGLDQLFNKQFGISVEHHGGLLGQLFAPFNHSPMAALAGIGAVVFGLSLAWTLYAGATSDPLPQKLGKLSRAMRNRFYFDEVYEGLIAITQGLLSMLADFVDRWIVAGLLVRGTHGTTELVGRGLRLLQSGNLQTYAFLFAAGVALVLFLALAH